MDGRRSPPAGTDPELLWLSVGLALLVAGLAVRIAAPQLVGVLPECVFHRLTGIACPTCGASRAASALLAGHALEAVSWNPLAGLAFIGGLLYVPYALAAVAGAVPRMRTGWLSSPMPMPLRWTLAAAVAANWLYLVAVGR